MIKSKIERIDFRLLGERFRETASYDVSEGVVIKNWEHFLKLAKKKGLYDGK